MEDTMRLDRIDWTIIGIVFGIATVVGPFSVYLSIMYGIKLGIYWISGSYIGAYVFACLLMYPLAALGCFAILMDRHNPV
jgi:disulfide bond formation protein DsbB